ncbi:helix-turn-helix domain-containing protein [Rhodococcus sp. IEGM 1401]|uniref:helix-turn-helix transcriptional regulator n=1 Tax=unclassified Rhodococcus (in: high G+C Gram-positive bacteria) TaxID=192944 RepID=UPI0022B5AFFC|nr:MULTISPECIES: helix-turn-helix domain-containing protein [unclassified Rhodococcus (in: high G+C Gram-positive bacteria)]MCZ4559885.1 helix-turn-helix domain-containing protein [Rhodococcus sp. IEGM 1401]MDI9920071.1 helix-turn-helix domain-containing protein [Rhodococcus sp. IEGM 1372]MDV8032466.1 helix-turn-helix domain-containing protein [Rhodococcus sp. IEGM 1414]
MDDLLTPAQCAELLNTSVGSLANRRYKGTGPTFVKLGQLVRYRRTDIETYLKGNRYTRTDTRATA